MHTVNHISMKRENYMITSIGPEKALQKKKSTRLHDLKKKKLTGFP